MSEESGHWYLRDGTPCHQVKKRDGGMRGFNLRWDRKMKAVPSVTTILSIIDKPALTNWKIDQAILAALTLPRKPDEGEKEYIARIKEDSKQQAINAANEGTRIHAAIEDHYAGRLFPSQYEKHVNAVVAEIARIFPGVNDWVCEKRFAHSLGFGGSNDLHSPSTGICIDHKGKDGIFVEVDGEWMNIPHPELPNCEPKRIAYDQNYQLAAYQEGLRLNTFERAIVQCGLNRLASAGRIFTPCANIFVSRTHPGKVASHVWSAEDIAYGWSVFEATLDLWKVLKKYDASF